MSRMARQKSASGIYHAITRGLDRQEVFRDREDRRRFLEILRDVQEVADFRLHAYCLMSNHVHLLLGEQNESLGSIMHRLNTRYAVWHNRKYERCGHVFQNRFISEPVEDEAYLITVGRYIHLNPRKAGIVDDPREYPWSSYRAYVGGGSSAGVKLETSLLLNLMGGRERLISFTEETNSDTCLEVDEHPRAKDEVIKERLKHLLPGASSVDLLQQLDRRQRNEIVRQLKAIEGSSIRQIAKVTGLGKTVVERA